MLSRYSRSTRSDSPRFNTVQHGVTPGLPAARRAGGQAKIRTHTRPEQRVMLVCVDLRLPWRRPTAAAGRPALRGGACGVIRGLREIRGSDQPVSRSPSSRPFSRAGSTAARPAGAAPARLPGGLPAGDPPSRTSGVGGLHEGVAHGVTPELRAAGRRVVVNRSCADRVVPMTSRSTALSGHGATRFRTSRAVR